MGNEIAKARERLTDNKQFESYLDVLKRTTQKLLMRRKVDLTIAKISSEKTTTKEMHLYSTGLVLGKIRRRDDADFWESTDVKPGPDEYKTGEDFDDNLLNTSPKNWTTGQILSAQSVIEKYRVKYLGEGEIPGERMKLKRTKLKDVWSKFMFSIAVTDTPIDLKLPYKVVDDRIKMFKTKSGNKCIGQIAPIENWENLLKKKIENIKDNDNCNGPNTKVKEVSLSKVSENIKTQKKRASVKSAKRTPKTKDGVDNTSSKSEPTLENRVSNRSEVSNLSSESVRSEISHENIKTSDENKETITEKNSQPTNDGKNNDKLDGLDGGADNPGGASL